MKTVEEVYEKLNDIEKYSGIGGVILFILIVLLFFGLYHFLKNYLSTWGQSEIKRNLESYKNELNTQLGQTLITSFSDVNKEIESLKAELGQAKMKELGFHTEKINSYKSFFESVVLFLNEATNPHHGGTDLWNQEDIRKRVAKISGLNAAIDINLGNLKLYSSDTKLHFECLKISKLLIDNIYTPPKQYLLKVRAELPLYNSLTEESEMKASIVKLNKLRDEYHEQLEKALEEIRDGVESFYDYFRDEYSKLLKEKDTTDNKA